MKRKDVLKRLSELLECSKECVEYSVKDGDTEALEYAIKELGGVDIKSLSKQISESLLKRTAQEVPVQEQLLIENFYLAELLSKELSEESSSRFKTSDKTL